MLATKEFLTVAAVIAVILAIVAWRYPKTIPAIVAIKIVTPF